MSCGQTTCATGRQETRNWVDTSSLRNILRQGVSYLDVWTARFRQRRALSNLDDRLLRDVGLTRDQARQEAQKPFWCA